MTTQHSRNMLIIKRQNELTLINTISLSEEGLKELDKLGAFHGRDDKFYLREVAVNFGH